MGGFLQLNEHFINGGKIMFKTLTIEGREIGFTANAATPFRFKQVFKKDLFAVFTDAERAEKEGFEAVAELAYIMARQAEKADMGKLNEEDFMSWLEDFGPMAFAEAAEDVLNIYTDSAKSTANP